MDEGVVDLGAERARRQPAPAEHGAWMVSLDFYAPAPGATTPTVNIADFNLDDGAADRVDRFKRWADALMFVARILREVALEYEADGSPAPDLD